MNNLHFHLLKGTKFHSTSKWVLKVLGQKGWLHGRVIENADADVDHAKGGESKDRAAAAKTKTKTKHQKKRTVNILEIGAINVELLTAASKTKRVAMKKSAQVKEKTKGDERNYSAPLRKYENVPLYNIRCRAIDIRSSHELIEEQDFLTLPLPTAAEGSSSSHYDVIVCSMVLNCVTSPTDRGKMLSLIHKQLSPGGLCFLTIPKLCLSQSKYIDRMLFEKILQLGVGFRIEEKKDSPKVAFWVLSKPEKGRNEEKGTTSRSKARVEDCKDEWSDLAILHRGKKYRNDFAVILEKS